MAAGIPKTTAYRLGSRRGARRIGSVTTVSPAGGPHRAFGAAVKDAKMADAGGGPQPTLCAKARPHQPCFGLSSSSSFRFCKMEKLSGYGDCEVVQPDEGLRVYSA